MKPETVKISVFVSEETARLLRIMAAELNLTKSQVIAKLVKDASWKAM